MFCPSSTGVIGVELPVRKITKNLPRLVAGLAENRFLDVARAIMTTDTQHKKAAVIAGDGRSVAGMTKGSGMIHPNMATTLGYVMTDAAIGPEEVRDALREAVELSYHRLTVDGDTSTNDTVILMANGASGVRPRKGFVEALTKVLRSLAIQIAMDGEGATKLIEIEVVGTKTNEDAARIGRAIANSPLVKTAVAGNDANWGRILCAAGYAGVKFDPAKTSVWLQDVVVCKNGLAAPFSESALQKKMNTRECRIRLEIAGRGKGTATFWTCDFTEGYIQVNASYRT